MLRLLPLLLAACTPVPDGPLSACDPLDETLCALPFPSSFYLKEASTPTGFQVDFRDGSLPVNRDEVPLSPERWNEKDGFSISGPLLAYFRDVSTDGLIGHDDLGAYLDDDATTVIVDLDTGARVPHFVELDMSADNPNERLLMLRPVVPLAFATHYAVGIRGLVTTEGTAIGPSPGFAALRGKKRTDDVDIESRRDRFDDVVFPALQDQGFEREDLLLAWDFVTVSRENTVGRMEWMRDDMYDRIGSDGPPYSVVVEDHDCEQGTIARTLEGLMTVPLYTQADSTGVELTRDASGQPFYNGDAQVAFTVRIPCSLAEDPAPATVVQYGHGLLGTQDEARTGWLSRWADDNRYVVVAADWTGMSEHDVGEITLMLVTDVSRFSILPERSQQGFVEQLALTRLVQGALAQDPAVTFDDISVIDPGEVAFYGISQGAILGGALLAMSPDLDRGVLGVGGMPYAILLSRSRNFDPFFLLFENKYEDHREITLVLGLVQMLWDPGESAGWMHDLADSDDRVLIQNAIGDAQVTTLGGHIQARGMDAVVLDPAPREVWGLQQVQGPITDRNVLVEWDYADIADEPYVNVPAADEDNTHECPRREPEAQQQVAAFIDGQGVINFCDGACVGVQEDTCPD